MKTEIIELAAQSRQLPDRIVRARTQPNREWVLAHGSGTLSDNMDQGFVWSIQCLAERLAYTFGYGFCAYKAHLVTFNDSISECDEAAYTLAGRWTKRYKARSLFSEDYFEVKYLMLYNEQGVCEWEGIGLVVRQTSASFVPANTMVVAKIARYDTSRHAWDAPVNFA